MAHFGSSRDIRHSHEAALPQYSLSQRTWIKCTTHLYPMFSGMNILVLFAFPRGPDWLIGTRSRHQSNARVQTPYSLDRRNTLSNLGSGLGTLDPSCSAFAQESYM